MPPPPAGRRGDTILLSRNGRRKRCAENKGKHFERRENPVVWPEGAAYSWRGENAERIAEGASESHSQQRLQEHANREMGDQRDSAAPEKMANVSASGPNDAAPLASRAS